MYDELVNSLRICGKIRSADDYCVAFHDGCCEAEPVCMYELMMKAADAIEELSRRCEQFQYMPPPAWISVTERLPDDRRDVQITVFWHDAWRTMYGYYDGAYWHLYAPTHIEVADVYVIGWMEKPTPMPLPQPPKEEE